MKPVNRTRNLTRCALLIALALALNYMERFIPLQMAIPLPGVKLGLANIVTLVALYMMGVKSAFIILIVRCILGSAFGGGISALLFSLTGGTMAVAAMAASRRCSVFSIYGVSILGAAAHNIGQICASMALMQSVYIAAYLPYLLGVAVFTGLATGAAGAGVLRIFRAARN